MSEYTQTFTYRPRTARLRTGKYKDIHSGDIILHLKEHEIEVSCLQREVIDYLLTVENPQSKLELLGKGYITVSQKRINIENPDWKVTYVNIFGAPYELPDETLNEHLQEYGTIVGRSRSHYGAHPEVENSIRHWRILLSRPVPGVLRVGRARLSIRYDGEPDSCHKCGSLGHSSAKCHIYRTLQRDNPPNAPTHQTGVGTPHQNPSPPRADSAMEDLAFLSVPSPAQPPSCPEPSVSKGSLTAEPPPTPPPTPPNTSHPPEPSPGEMGGQLGQGDHLSQEPESSFEHPSTPDTPDTQSKRKRKSRKKQKKKNKTEQNTSVIQLEEQAL